MRLCTRVAVFLSLLLSLPIFAGGYSGASFRPEPYIGVAFGTTSVSGDLVNAINTNSPIPDIVDDTDKGASFYGGLMMTRNFGVEVGYHELGTYTDTLNIGLKGDTSAYYLSAVGVLPINKQFSLFAKVGVARWNADFTIPGVSNQSLDGNDPIYSAGATFQLSDTFGISLNYTRVDIDSDNVKSKLDAIKLGFNIRFKN